MTTAKIFGELRHLVHAPSAQNFQGACALYEQLWRAHPERARDEVLPFLTTHMQSFEDELRVLPARWVLMWLEGQLPEELARLGRGISTERSYRLTEQDVDALIALTHLTQPVRFEVSGSRLGRAHWARVFAQGCFEHVRSLEASGSLEDDQSMVSALAEAGVELEGLYKLKTHAVSMSEELLHKLESAPFARRIHTLSLGGELALASWCACKDLMHGLRSLSLEYVELSEADMHALAHCEQLTTLEHLSLTSCNITNALAIMLAKSPYISGLQTLELSSNPIGSGGLSKLATSKLIDGVRTLHLKEIPAKAAALKKLGASKKLRGLQELDLYNLGDEDAAEAFLAALATNPHVTGMRSIRANHSFISDQTVQALAARKDLGELRTLGASFWRAHPPTWRALFASPLGASLKYMEALSLTLTDERGTIFDEAPQSLQLEAFRYGTWTATPEQSEVFQAAALAHLQGLSLEYLKLNPHSLAAPALPMSKTLRLLECDNDSMDEDTLVWLLEQGHLAHLERLVIRRCNLGARTIEALVNATHLTQLRHIDFWSNPDIGDAAARIFGSHHMRTLESISLIDVGMGGEALAAALAELDHDCPLHTLELGNNPLGDVGVIAIAESAHLRALSSCSLYGCGLGDAGAQAVASSTNFRRSVRVYLGKLDFSPATMQALASSPNLPDGTLR